MKYRLCNGHVLQEATRVYILISRIKRCNLFDFHSESTRSRGETITATRSEHKCPMDNRFYPVVLSTLVQHIFILSTDKFDHKWQFSRQNGEKIWKYCFTTLFKWVTMYWDEICPHFKYFLRFVIFTRIIFSWRIEIYRLRICRAF